MPLQTSLSRPPLLYAPLRTSRRLIVAPGFSAIRPGPGIMPRGFRPGLRGFGSLTAQNQSIASVASSAAVLTGTILGGPIGGAIAGAIAQVGVLLANVFAGCGQTCVEASNLANEAEPLLLQNLQTYMSAPVHYASLQAGALNNFNLTWQALESACSSPSLGSAGQSCISDRQQGGCHYKTSPGGWNQVNGVWTYTYPGASGSGSTCWNWFVGYHDPIANDPTVVPDPAGSAGSVTSAISSILPSSIANATILGIPVSSLLLPAAALAAIAFLFD